jgi:hypothetical protein
MHLVGFIIRWKVLFNIIFYLDISPEVKEIPIAVKIFLPLAVGDNANCLFLTNLKLNCSR